MANYHPAVHFVKQIDRDVAAFIQGSSAYQSDDRFNELALREFELLYRSSKPYREYCNRKKLSPLTITHWSEIPAVSSFPFRKDLSVSSSLPDTGEFSYQSGVVGLGRRRGPIFPDKDTRALTSIANDMLAKRFVFPDIERIEMLLMVPSPLMAPGMVMASGLDQMMKRFGTRESRFLISFRGLKLKALMRSLRHAEKSGQPVALLGATFVIDYFLDACEGQGIRIKLPQGSRVVDSGGFMGRYTKCTKEEYFAKCRKMLCVREEFCVNALWICESSTVYFDNTLKNACSGLAAERRKELPPWTRVMVVDTRNFFSVPKGNLGLLRLYDLTNRAMAFAVQTDKMGVETEHGFEVVGKWDRHAGAADIDRSPQHPGGKAATKVMDFFMRRKLAKLGEMYSGLK
jgi:hypothetical protein